MRYGVLEYISIEHYSLEEMGKQGIKKIITDREQEYFNLYFPTLNVNPIANSRLGAKLSEATRQKISEAKSGVNHHMFGKTHSKATRLKISIAQSGKTPSEQTKLKKSQANGTSIYVYNLEYELLYTFTSSRMAAKHFICGDKTIMKYARNGEIFKKEYQLSLEVIKSL